MFSFFLFDQTLIKRTSKSSTELACSPASTMFWVTSMNECMAIKARYGSCSACTWRNSFRRSGMTSGNRSITNNRAFNIRLRWVCYLCKGNCKGYDLIMQNPYNVCKIAWNNSKYEIMEAEGCTCELISSGFFFPEKIQQVGSRLLRDF